MRCRRGGPFVKNMPQSGKTHKRKKITVIGCGFVGSACAHWITVRGLADIAMIDISGGLAKGRALDLYEAAPLAGSDLQIQGGSDYSLAENSDIVIITAGLPRKPGMSRADLLSANSKIMKDICGRLKPLAGKAVFIIVSNPLDAMVYLAHKILDSPRERILGMAGVLDTARLKAFIAERLQISAKDISALVLGGHGDDMAPLTRFCSAGGVPLEDLTDKKTIDELIERTRKGGGEIVSLLQTGSAACAPALSAVDMAEAILRDQNRILPCAALLQGEYGEKGVFAGVPCLLGGGGLKKIIEISLNQEERSQLKASIASVRKTLAELKSLL